MLLAQLAQASPEYLFFHCPVGVIASDLRTEAIETQKVSTSISTAASTCLRSTSAPRYPVSRLSSGMTLRRSG